MSRIYAFILFAVLVLPAGSLLGSKVGDSKVYNPYAKIAQLEEDQLRLEQQLELLPVRSSAWLGERFGFHSVFRPPSVSAEGHFSEWVELRFNRPTPVVAIALVPAVDPQGDRSGSYGFPMRFRIEFYDNRDGAIVHTIDYTDTDFEDPGIAPVIFDELNFTARSVRIIVEKGQIDNGMEFFALSEVLLLEKRGDNIVNIAPYSKRSASADFRSYPYWDIRFLADRVSSLGFPIGRERKENSDFIAELPPMLQSETVEMVFDLGKAANIGRAAFYPADPPLNILLPHFGYPDQLVIEVFKDAELKVPVSRVEVVPDYELRTFDPSKHFRPVTDLAFAVPMSAAAGRYVRVTASGLPKYNNGSILALGEIIFWRAHENVSLECDVMAFVGGEEREDLAPHRLVDGAVNSYMIIDTFDWLKGLSTRAHVEQDLAGIVGEIDELNHSVELWWRYLISALFILLVSVSLFLGFRIRRARKLAVGALREQISRDLHDDVGCNIGSLAWGISNLREEVKDSSLDEDFDELDLVARETAVALEEAIYFTQKDQTTYLDLASRLQQRARIILGEGVGEFTIEGEAPDSPVDFQVKRQIILLYKEALYNCARHANATRVEIEIRFEADQLHICLRDNGVGFDSECLDRISGLSNMEKRAEKVGGKFSIESIPEKGTELIFSARY